MIVFFTGGNYEADDYMSPIHELVICNILLAVKNYSTDLLPNVPLKKQPIFSLKAWPSSKVDKSKHTA